MRFFVFLLALFSLKSFVSTSKLFDCLSTDTFFPDNYTGLAIKTTTDAVWNGHTLYKRIVVATHSPVFFTLVYKGNLKEIPCDINYMASNLKRCLNDKEKGEMLDRVIQEADALCKADIDEQKLIGCVKSDEQGLKNECPNMDEMIFPMLKDMITGCCKAMANRECVVNRMKDGCRDFLANTTIVANMFAYTVMEFNFNESEMAKKQDNEYAYDHCPRMCAKLATGEKPEQKVRDGVADAAGHALASAAKNLKAGMYDAADRVNRVGAKDHVVAAVLAVGEAAANVRDGAVDMAVRVGQAVADAATNVKEGAVNVAVGAKDHVVAGAEAVGDAA